MIQLSPQVTAAATESPDADSIRQNAVKGKEKDDTNAFSKLLDGILKKVKAASVSEHSQEGLLPEKASRLSKMKASPEDETNGNEGIAALFARREGLLETDYLPRKSELLSGGEDVEGLEKNASPTGELEPKRLSEEISFEKESRENTLAADADVKKTGHADSFIKTHSLVQAGAQSEHPGADVSLRDISSEGFDQTALDAGENQQTAESGEQPQPGFVDALKAESEKASIVTEYLFNSQAKPALVDADASSEANRESSQEGKVKDKRKERLSLESAENRINASQETAHDLAHHADEALSNQKVDAEIVVELRDGSRQSEERGLARENRNASVFQDMLSRELRDGLNTEIVRHASLVLKENGEGLIRLSLRPESLGDIKIRLEMADNKVTGRIVLESEEALKAFEKEITGTEF